MTKTFSDLTESKSLRLLVSATKQAAEQCGLDLKKMPGRGLSAMYVHVGNGKRNKFAIKTTRNRWIAFSPLEGGKVWKTLDEVDEVLVAAVDSQKAPTAIAIYQFPAEEVRKRFDEAYKARIAAGHKLTDGYGMWVCLDPVNTDAPTAAGSGIADEYSPKATYSIKDLLKTADQQDDASSSDDAQTSPAAPSSDVSAPIDSSKAFATIGEVMAWARQRISELASVPVDAVKLDLTIKS